MLDQKLDMLLKTVNYPLLLLLLLLLLLVVVLPTTPLPTFACNQRVLRHTFWFGIAVQTPCTLFFPWWI